MTVAIYIRVIIGETGPTRFILLSFHVRVNDIGSDNGASNRRRLEMSH